MKQYYYSTKENEQKGPIAESTLINCYQKGVYPKDTFVWREGMSQWRELERVMAELKVQPPSSANPMGKSKPKTPSRNPQLAPGSVDANASFEVYLYMPIINMFNFKARSTRKEWWIFSALFFLIVCIFALGFLSEDMWSLLFKFLYSPCAIAWLSLSIRRMHDISWDWRVWAVSQGIASFLVVISYIVDMNPDATLELLFDIFFLIIASIVVSFNPLLFFIAALVDSKKGSNQFGPSPKYINS